MDEDLVDATTPVQHAKRTERIEIRITPAGKAAIQDLVNATTPVQHAKRTERIEIRVTPAGKAAIQQQAARENYRTVSDMARVLLQRGLTVSPKR